MKIKTALLIGALYGALTFYSCSDPYPKSIELKEFMYLSLSGAADNPIVRTVDLDKTSAFSLHVSYGGTTNYEQGDISAEIVADHSLVKAYNTKNNTAYLPLPEKACTFDKSSVLIKNGSRISDALNITLQPNLVNFAYEYLLPVTIKSASGGEIPINEKSKTVYFILKGNVKNEPSEEKWTVHGASSVWQDPYKVENTYDGVRGTYWHTSLDGMPQWFAINMNEYKMIEGFTWVNRQDDAAALPKHVKFETSLNGTEWTEVLDVPEMPRTKGLQILELPEKTVALYFKVTVLSNWVNAPYTYLAEISTWAGKKPAGDYNWEKSTWKVIDFKSEWNSESWGVKNIFDNNKNTCWHSEPINNLKGMPQWFIVDMKKNRPAIKGFLIWNRQDDHGLEPKHVVFSVSDDKTKWTEILNLKEMSNDHTKELNYKTENLTSGRYLKVEVKTNWANGDWTYFGEITPY